MIMPLVLSAVAFWHGNAIAERVISTVIRLGDVAYYMHPLPLMQEHPSAPHHQLDIGPKNPQSSRPGTSIPSSNQAAEPCTLLTVSGSFPTTEQLRTTFQAFSELDDVWSNDFLECIIIQFTESQRSLTDDERTVVHDLGTSNLYAFHQIPGVSLLPEGPYLLDHGCIHQIYRLYPDTSGAFVVSTVPTANDM